MAEGLIQAGLSFQGNRSGFLHFQLHLLGLEQGRYEILADDRFVTELLRYLTELHRAGYFDFAHRILVVLGECAVCHDQQYRGRALFVLSLFAATVSDSNDDETNQALSWIFSRWLQQERVFLTCYETVCSQLQNVLVNMLSRGMYCQLTPWLNLLDRIVSGILPRSGAIQAVAGRLYRTVLDALLEHDLVITDNLSIERRQNLVSLYRYFASGGAAPLVQELYSSADRNRRMALISILSSLDDNVAYVLIEGLADNSPWYMIRNAVQVISQLGNTGHFDLVRPFLSYPDIRVQQQMVEFISRLDSRKSLDQRLHALEICDDRLKPQLIRSLAEQQSKAVELALVHMLRNRNELDPEIQDELVLILCRELRYYPTIRVVKTLQHLIDERQIDHASNDAIVMTARETIDILCTL
jgi:hypothetical protein